MASIITLTTDFGTADGYVGAMKGVIARLAPEAVVVDLAHDIPRHDIAHAAWVIATSAPEFPTGTVHVVVVDPGVGGDRLEVVVEARGQRYVAPDNGVLAYVAAGEGVETYAITSTAFRRPDADVSPTFHGRDVFAPAAAALARGLPVTAAGPATCLAGQLPWAPTAFGGRGAVVHVDVYGNLITNIRTTGHQAQISGREIAVRRTYQDVPDGALVAYVGSAGTIEIGVRNGSAAKQLGVGRGSVVEVM
jgi:S-adenosylmethionine hydrolase